MIMTQKVRAAAKSLAVRYSAVNEAFARDPVNAKSVRVWARLLEESQKKMGIELIEPNRLSHLTSYGETAIVFGEKPDLDEFGRNV